MEFRRIDRLNCWEAGGVVLRGQEVSVFLPDWYEGDARFQVIEGAMKRLEASWTIIQDAICASLLPEHSADPGAGRAVLNREDFLAKLLVYHVTIDEDELGISLSVLFRDSGVFGGHSVVVDLLPDSTVDAHLFG